MGMAVARRHGCRIGDAVDLIGSKDDSFEGLFDWGTRCWDVDVERISRLTQVDFELVERRRAGV